MFMLLNSLMAPPVFADETAAESCLKNKVWEGYGSGWEVRNMATATLGQGEYKVYVITLYAATEYRVTACGDGELSNADLILYDALGNQVLKDISSDREPTLSYTPSATDTFYLAVYATTLNNGSGKGSIALALTYK